MKFPDDTALVSLHQGSELDHGSFLPAFDNRCDENFLDLNVSKTKELIVYFRKCRNKPKVSSIHCNEVEIVDTYKYLGTLFDSLLKFDTNADSIVQRNRESVY